MLLPDGRILVVAGHSDSGHPGQKQAGYVDPANGFAHALGASSTPEFRGYHTVTLLLPDGSVLVGGGRDLDLVGSLEKPDFRYLYPDYLFANRPAILTAPPVVRLGATFTVKTAGKKPNEFVLLGLGSMTHSFDFNQRYVELERTRFQRASIDHVPPAPGIHATTLRAPADARVAPPGHYLLFVLDLNRIPSAGAIVRLQ